MLKATINLLFLLIFKFKFNLRPPNIHCFLLGLVISLSCYPSFAQASNSITINQSNIAKPLTIQGTSGGGITAQEISQTEKTTTGYCKGYVSPQPNHLLKLESFWEFLRLEVASQADTTILVKGAGGVWCNDDAGTTNPIIEGQWQPGLYQVWVGSYQANSTNDYQIKITGK